MEPDHKDNDSLQQIMEQLMLTDLEVQARVNELCNHPTLCRAVSRAANPRPQSPDSYPLLYTELCQEVGEPTAKIAFEKAILLTDAMIRHNEARMALDDLCPVFRDEPESD